MDTRTQSQRAEAAALQTALAARGIIALYGGGSRSKGHGFWLYRVTREAADLFLAADIVTDDAAIIKNDGKASGNPSFHMFADAAKFAE